MLAARHRARLAMADKNPDSQEAKLKSVRRRLNFGDDDNSLTPSKEEIERKFAEEMDKHDEEKKAKWNFDFKAERPLEGHWEWERVESAGKPSQKNGSYTAPENGDARSGRPHQGDAAKQAP